MPFPQDLYLLCLLADQSRYRRLTHERKAYQNRALKYQHVMEIVHLTPGKSLLGGSCRINRIPYVMEEEHQPQDALQLEGDSTLDHQLNQIKLHQPTYKRSWFHLVEECRKHQL